MVDAIMQTSVSISGNDFIEHDCDAERMQPRSTADDPDGGGPS
jgi:hypothetical protein